MLSILMKVMQIFIKTLTGRKTNFNFELDNTVRHVKEALQDASASPFHYTVRRRRKESRWSSALPCLALSLKKRQGVREIECSLILSGF